MVEYGRTSGSLHMSFFTNLCRKRLAQKLNAVRGEIDLIDSYDQHMPTKASVERLAHLATRERELEQKLA